MFRTLFAFFMAAFVFTGCTPNNVTVDNSLKNFFDSAGVQGSFALFDNGQGHFTIYNLSRYKDSAYAPGRTFDIVQALVGLQTGVLKDDTSRLVWTSFFALPYPGAKMDTTKATGPEGLRTLLSAFQDTTRLGDMDFVGLAGKIGRDTLRRWIDTLHYGKGDLGLSVDSSWLNGRLKITSDEQLGLIKRLYFDQLPFYNRPQKLVRGIMPAESNSKYRLVYKTGQVVKEDGHVLGWVLGWVEENKHPYFFVVNLESNDPGKDLGAMGLHIVKKILAPMGVFEGKK